MIVKKLSTLYLLQDDTKENKPWIRVSVNEDNGALNLVPRHGGQYFEFRESEPEMVETIAQFFVEAAKLGKEVISRNTKIPF